MIRLSVQGMTCAACVGRVERALKKVPGVADAVVNLATGEATVEGPDDLEVGSLRKAIEKAGYQAQEHPDQAREARHEHQRALGRDHQDGGGEGADHPVGHPLDGQARGLGLLDQAYDARQRRVGTHGHRLNNHTSRAVEAAPQNSLARCALHGQALARNQ